MDISVILCTYNRGELLANALESLHRQKVTGISYELLIVDNNSTDHTRELVQRFVDKNPHFRYIFEKRQGLSHARNAGIAAAKAELLLFTDDDIEFSETWIQSNYEASLRFPEADYFGGKVLPIWEQPQPDWLKHSVNPLAIQNHPGDVPLKISPEYPHCLVGASLAIRRRAFERAGLFSVETQRVKGGIGSTEDFDWEMKVWAYGGHGMYVPEPVCWTKIPLERMKKSYHRRWHRGNGKFQAISCNSEYEGTRRLHGVPLFVYRQAAQSAMSALKARLSGRPDAFWYETRFWFFVGFVREKWKSQRTPEQVSAPFHQANVMRSADSQG
jgi:glycosyltransferase involved in cell wall biosynthesis